MSSSPGRVGVESPPRTQAQDVLSPSLRLSRPRLVTFGEAVLTLTPISPQVFSLPQRATTDSVPQLQSIGGAELNTAVAFALIDGPSTSAWVSLLPTGVLGESVLSAAQRAGVDTTAVGSIDGASLGTLHVVDDGGGARPLYQRSHSAFCTRAGVTVFPFSSLFGSGSGSQWLHVTGITPLLGDGPRAAWRIAVQAAHAAGTLVSLDLNYRPALGTLDELVDACVREELPHIALLMLSEDTLRAIAEREGVWSDCTESGVGMSLSDTLHVAQVCALAALRVQLCVPLLACCFKRPLSGGGSSKAGSKDTLHGGAGVKRWSAIAFDGGIASTVSTPTEHVPLQALGGGDAWVAGFLQSVMDASFQPGAISTTPIASVHAALHGACRRGDLLAALAMATRGDLSDVTRMELMAVETRWRGVTARLHLPMSPSVTHAAAPPAAAAPTVPSTPLDVLPVISKPPPSSAAVFARLCATRFVPVVLLEDPDDAVPVARALLAGGCSTIELVLRTPAAEECLARIARDVPEMLLGAGTVLTPDQADRAVGAGAAYIISPAMSPHLVSWARIHNVPFIPGVATATEVCAAVDAGHTLLKFFPAECLGGARALAALAAPFSKVQWMPTGGVSLANMAMYLRNPSVAAVGGSWLVPAEALVTRDFSSITRRAREALAAVKSAAANSP